VAKTLSVHDFAHEAVHEFLHLDGKIGRSLKLLVARPGELTREFVAGRRARYISSLRLYLTFSLIFFFLAAVNPGGGRKMVEVSAGDERQVEEIASTLEHNIPRVMFLLMPAFALLTFALFRKSQPYYVPHLYYSVHFHAFLFLLLSVVALLGFAGALGKYAGSLLFFAAIPYHYAALRRVFEQPWRTTIWKGTVAGVLYVLLIAGAMAGLVLYTISGH
jgi:Na+/H+ antiporter NhaC